MAFDTVLSRFGLKKEPPLTSEELAVADQLRRNRDAVVKDIPPDMREEFFDSIFSEKSIRHLVAESFRQPVARFNRPEFFRASVASCFGIRAFATRLMAYHQLDPKKFYERMVAGCDVPPAENFSGK